MLSRTGFFASLPLIVLAGTASAGNARLEALLNNQATGPVSNICYVRHYDKAHLASHPKQNVTDMLTYIAKLKSDEPGGYDYYSVSVQVKFRDSKKQFSFGANCGEVTDKPGVSIRCGIDCDGGGFEVEAKDDKSIELKIGEGGVRLGDPEDDAPLGSEGFQSDDNTFLLQQTDLKNCLPLIDDDDLAAAIKKGTVTQ